MALPLAGRSRVNGNHAGPLGRCGRLSTNAPARPLRAGERMVSGMAYKRVTVKEQTYPGEEVEKVLSPCQESPAWIIYLKSGLKIVTTHPVTCVVEEGK